MRLALFFAACVGMAINIAVAAPTRTCNTVPWMFMVDLWGVSPQLRARIDAATAGHDSDMAAKLGNVQRLEAYNSSLLGQAMLLHYDPVENVQEIAAALNADPAIRSQMGIDANPDGHAGCFAAGSLPAERQVVTEYYNTALDHYFLSSTPQENAFLDSGGAGPAWVRTGESFTTYVPENCQSPLMSKYVYRFYGTPHIGSNSHFFTAGPEECGSLRNGVGWTYEGRAFGAELPSAGICPANAPVPVYRAYNMRWAQNDSNHRHTTSFMTYQQMIARGWYGEGIAFCVPNS